MQAPARRQRLGTVRAPGTTGTDLCCKHHLDALLCPTPARAALALRTGGLLGLPVQLEVREIKAPACFGLPTVVRQGRPQQPDAILLLAAHEQISIDVTCIHDLFIWQQVAL